MKKDNTNKPKRRHTQATRDKIREKRLARTTQPRNSSQSKKRKSLYEELKEDYKKDKNALKWLEENKYNLGFIDGGDKLENSEAMIKLSKDWGIQTEFSEMYDSQYERKVGNMLYSEDDVDKSEDNNNTLIDEIDNRWAEDEL